MAHVSLATHAVETALWLGLALIAYRALDVGAVIRTVTVKDAECKSSSMVETVIDTLLGCVHFGMYLHLLYFKTNSKALIIVLLQPCHVILLLEGIAVVSRSKVGVNISLFILPALIGTLLAMLFPDTSGLEQFLEEPSYWVQHYLIQAIPLYLLCRRNFQVARLCSWKTVLTGLWILHTLHYTVYEGIDLLITVNVEFMLCPTGAMASIFDLLPPAVLYPSYRTPLTAVVLLVAPCIAYSYVFAARFLMLATRAKADKKKVKKL